MVLENFGRLEEGVTRLIKSHKLLEAENAGLRDALRDKEKEIGELRARIKSLDREKETVKEKIEFLLGRLDGLLENA